MDCRIAKNGDKRLLHPSNKVLGLTVQRGHEGRGVAVDQIVDDAFGIDGFRIRENLGRSYGCGAVSRGGFLAGVGIFLSAPGTNSSRISCAS